MTAEYVADLMTEDWMHSLYQYTTDYLSDSSGLVQSMDWGDQIIISMGDQT